MKAAMGRSVYKKLRAQYGNSFHNVITHYSNTNYKEDEHDENIRGKRERILRDIDMTESRIDDGLGAFVEICSGINSNEDDAMVYKDLGEFYFLTDGNLHPRECIVSSEKVRREIEHLAERIARSIIGAKGSRK